MPRMNQVYYSKVLVGFIVGTIFGVTGFANWPAGLTMFAVYLVLSTAWMLALRNTDQGVKIRSYYTSAVFQYFMSCIAIWTLIYNLMYVAPTNWVFVF